MSSARELVEHQYSEGGLLFTWLTNKRKLKVLERDLRPMGGRVLLPGGVPRN
jgi:hypothetical protein